MSHPLFQRRREVLKTLFASSLALSGLAAAASPDEAQAYQLGCQAYMYGYPLIYFARMRYARMAKGDPATGEKIRWGVWAHRNRMATPEISGAPQTDCLYSSAWLDLAREPFLLRIPHTDGRYWSVQCCDLFGVTYAMPDRRDTQGETLVALVGPDWQGTLPPGVSKVYRSAMSQSFLVMRMFFANAADRPQAIGLQQQFSLYPLSAQADPAAWNGLQQVPPAPFNPATDPLADFKTLQQMWQQCPPPAADAAIWRRYAAIGLARDVNDGLAGLSAAVRSGLQRAEADMRRKIVELTRHFPGDLSPNGWIKPKASIGIYNDGDYEYRAAVALLGTVATPPDENTYYVAQQEADGARLNGDHRYVIHYPGDQLPQCRAFWSLHAYRYEGYTLIPNAINRYAIGDRSEGLRYDADGGLTLYVQADDPGAEKHANWLPVMPGKDFFLLTRAYEPQGAMRDLSWPGPTIRRIA